MPSSRFFAKDTRSPCRRYNRLVTAAAAAAATAVRQVRGLRRHSSTGPPQEHPGVTEEMGSGTTHIRTSPAHPVVVRASLFFSPRNRIPRAGPPNTAPGAVCSKTQEPTTTHTPSPCVPHARRSQTKGATVASKTVVADTGVAGVAGTQATFDHDARCEKPRSQ